MTADEKRETVLTNYRLVKKFGRVIESDHNPVKIEVNISFSKIKPEKKEFFSSRKGFLDRNLNSLQLIPVTFRIALKTIFHLKNKL